MRRLLLRLLLAIGLCLAGLGGGGFSLPAAAASLVDGAHHGPQDGGTGHGACARSRCECDGCPHLAAPRLFRWALPLQRGRRWPPEARTAWGAGPEVEDPPPRSPRVEMS
ncbi:hypothetical protein V5F53_08525 [Xanthobacter sp. V4C-4]|uniref:hypothetical protein n=1 Tax=Xanthobacter cornucopiae TaxID=3119924 RepID=UPI003729304D